MSQESRNAKSGQQCSAECGVIVNQTWAKGPNKAVSSYQNKTSTRTLVSSAGAFQPIQRLVYVRHQLSNGPVILRLPSCCVSRGVACWPSMLNLRIISFCVPISFIRSSPRKQRDPWSRRWRDGGDVTRAGERHCASERRANRRSRAEVGT